ncbi:TetR/AcrR family transcriptional regulator [Thermosulfidibacter takaii]|nr:TetR/AcrR family transcriptional regulator [Thermosulfidibacter takaii]
MGRREREFQLRKREILDAALELFAKKGYAGTSMQEIAKEAEFAVGTLYKFFPTKEELYRELVLERARGIHDTLMSAFDEAEVIPLLKKIVQLKWQIMQENRVFLKLYFSELWETRFSLQQTLTGEVKQLYRRYFERLVWVFKRGVEEGVFKRKSPRLYALAFEGMVNNILLEALDEDSIGFLPEDVLDLFLNSILLEG